MKRISCKLAVYTMPWIHLPFKNSFFLLFIKYPKVDTGEAMVIEKYAGLLSQRDVIL